ncbi:MAG: GNAT family N-acetyltransferase [Quadrisphaera sp.]
MTALTVPVSTTTTSTSTSTVAVVPAAPADLPEAADLLADAFAGEPQVAALLGAGTADTPDARRRRVHLYRAELVRPLAEGTVDLARDPDGGALLGVAVWHAPRPAGGGVLHALRALPDHLRAFGASGVPRALSAQRAFGRARPRSPHWYLEAVGVAPAGQGRGVGRALLQHRLDRVDEAREDSYLESSSPRTTPLYRRLGFVPLGPVRGLPSREAPLGMWRVSPRR